MKTLLIFLFLLLVTSCGNDGTNTGNTDDNVIPNGTISLSNKVQQKTPKGMAIFSPNGVSDQQLAQADAALDETIKNAKASGYSGEREFRYDFYQVNVPKDPCVESPEDHVKSFKIRGDNYDGSIYDKYNTKGELPADQQNNFNKYVKDGVGVVYAAELVLNVATPGSTPANLASYVVCPDNDVWQNGVQYGAEHIVVANLDPNYNQITMTHDIISHPILPKRQVGAARVKKPAVKVDGAYIVVPAK